MSSVFLGRPCGGRLCAPFVRRYGDRVARRVAQAEKLPPQAQLGGSRPTDKGSSSVSPLPLVNGGVSSAQ